MRLETFVHCTSTAPLRILDDAAVPAELRSYLEWEPEKERTYRGWRFLAPSHIVRSEDEDFYFIAMHRHQGSVETIAWRRDGNQWQVRTHGDDGKFHATQPIGGTFESMFRRIQ